MKRRSRLIALAAVFFVAVGAAFVGARLAQTGSSNGAKGARPAFNKFAKGDPDANSQFKAGIANEGPGSTLEAQQEAQRAYPADSIPDGVAASSALLTYNGLKSKSGKGAWQSIGPSQAKYPAVLDQFLAAAGVHRLRPRDRARDRRSARRAMLALPRRGRRRGLGHRQGDSTRTATSTGITSPARSARTRSARCSSIRAIRPATRSTPAPANRMPRAIPRPASASTSPPTAARPGRSFPAATSSSRIARSVRWPSTAPATCSFRHRQRASAASARSSSGAVSSGTPRIRLRHSRPLPADRRDVHADPGVQPLDPRLDHGRRSTRPTPASSTSTSFQQGIWRSLDNGATWTQIKTPLNAALNTDRAEFAVDNAARTATRACTSASATTATPANRRASIAPTTPQAPRCSPT